MRMHKLDAHCFCSFSVQMYLSNLCQPVYTGKVFAVNNAINLYIQMSDLTLHSNCRTYNTSVLPFPHLQPSPTRRGTLCLFTSQPSLATTIGSTIISDATPADYLTGVAGYIAHPSTLISTLNYLLPPPPMPPAPPTLPRKCNSLKATVIVAAQ